MSKNFSFFLNYDSAAITNTTNMRYILQLTHTVSQQVHLREDDSKVNAIMNNTIL